MSERQADYLRLIPIFSALQPEEMLTIEQYMLFNKIEPGAVVFREGEKAITSVLWPRGSLMSSSSVSMPNPW